MSYRKPLLCRVGLHWPRADAEVNAYDKDENRTYHREGWACARCLTPSRNLRKKLEETK